MMAKKIKVLVIRFSSIGDIVLTTPVLRCLKKVRNREIEVHVATKKAFADLLAYNPYVDKLHLLDGKLSALINQLRQENFDHIIDLHHNTRSAMIKWSLRKRSTAFNKLNVQKWLMTNFKINRLPDVHIIDRYFEAAAPLGVTNDHAGLDFFLPGHAESTLQSLPPAFQNGFVAFAIGGQHATKRLPNEKIVALINRSPLPVILLGGHDDTGNAKEITRQCTVKVFNGCGLFSIHQSAYVIKSAKLVVTHDTGLMHIAAAFEKPVISIWGNTIPGFGMYPYLPKHPERLFIAEVHGLKCRPCSKIGFAKCPKRHFDCMMLMDEDRIAGAMHAMLHPHKDR